MPQAIIFLISGNYFFYPILSLLIILKKRIFLLILFLMGIIQSLIFYYPYYQYKFLINKKLWVTGVITDLKKKGIVILAKKLKLNNKTYQFNSKIFLYSYTNLKFIKPGDMVRAKIKLKKPENYPIPGAFNFKNYLKGNQILFSGYLYPQNIHILKRKNQFFQNYKNFLKKLIESQKVNERIKFFEKGMILGEKNSFPNYLKNFLTQNGISHLFVISGLHVSIVYIFLVVIFRLILWKLDNYYFPFLLSIPLTFFYIIITGMGYPALRAFFLICAGIITIFVKRKRDTLRIFFSIFLFLIIFKPFCYLNISFEYSFIIVYFLILTFKLYEINGNLKKIIITTIICFLAGIPLTCYYFNEIHLKGLVINLFAVPFFSFLIIPFSVLFLFLPIKIFLTFISFLFKIFINIITFFPDIPYLFPVKPVFIELILWYLILYSFIFLFKKEFFYQKITVFSLLIIISIFLNFKIHNFKNKLGIINLKRTKAIVLNYNNKNFLINGGNKNLILGYLLFYNIHSLDYLILTEYKKVFLDSSEYLLANFKIKKFYYPGRFDVKLPDFVKIKKNYILINNFKVNFKKLKKRYYETILK